MILINSAPGVDRVLLDANSTPIEIVSSFGAGYYFRAFIKINNVAFDEQGWSRENATVARKNLEKLFYAYFAPIFNPALGDGFFEQTHLVKEVQVLIAEYSLSSDVLVDEGSLPVFYIMHNRKPQLFSDQDKIQILDVQPAVLRVPRDGKVELPIFVNASSDALVAKIFSENGTTVTIDGGTVDGKKAFLFSHLIATLNIPETDEYFTIEIACGNQIVSKTYKFISLINFGVQKLAFLNNFGYWITTYFDGELELVSAYKGETYLQDDGTEKVFEISEDATYTLNTGSLLSNEKAIIRQVANATETKLLVDGQWLEMVNKSKRYRELADQSNTFEEDFIFGLRLDRRFENTGVGPVTTTPVLTITGTSVSGPDVTIDFTISDYIYPVVKLQLSSDGITFNDSDDISIVSPQLLTLLPGTWYIRIASNGYTPQIFSNVVTVVVS
ncbi:hypothetical protein [Flavobacterium sp.]|uniref:hypothetical protein n=1 Tax=Flavobacterium sp. TaxID=239 RepID=UPI00121E5F59|nr:hypothetical protein [Flavobacterium sp.]RZJ71065.1 MAG: hypothetical protein EOO49_11470 [Flavobacterium sp.]